jgi:hypothetical protein
VATPAATPSTLNAVISRSTAGRFADRRYLVATNHSKFKSGASFTPFRFPERLFRVGLRGGVEETK